MISREPLSEPIPFDRSRRSEMDDSSDSADPAPRLRSPVPTPPDSDRARPPKAGTRRRERRIGRGHGANIERKPATGARGSFATSVSHDGKPFMSTTEVLFPDEPLVHCFWCERLHRGEHGLAVCPACTVRLATMRPLQMSGSSPLIAGAIDHSGNGGRRAGMQSGIWTATDSSSSVSGELAPT